MIHEEDNAPQFTTNLTVMFALIGTACPQKTLTVPEKRDNPPISSINIKLQLK